MKKARSAGYIFDVWVGIALISILFSHFPKEVIAVTTAVAGAILAMLTDTMIPEAFEQAHNFAELITVFFLAAFVSVSYRKINETRTVA